MAKSSSDRGLTHLDAVLYLHRHPMRSRRLPAALILAFTGLALLAACSEPLGLPLAHLVNEVDTVSLFALDGTPLFAPSAYELNGRSRIRTDQSPNFDFAFNVDALNRAVLLQTGSLGLGQASGILTVTTPFDSVKVAPSGGYEFAQPVVVDTGTVAVIRSRPQTCSFGATLYLYAKLRVLAIDIAARRIDFLILVDENCGYRGLEPGLPKT